LSSSKKPHPKGPRSASYWPPANSTSGFCSLQTVSSYSRRFTRNSVSKDALLEERSAMRKERSAVYGKVARWRVRWVDDTGQEHPKVFRLKEAAQSHLDKVTADVVKGEYVSPRSSAVTFGQVAKEQRSGSKPSKRGSRRLSPATCRCWITWCCRS